MSDVSSISSIKSTAESAVTTSSKRLPTIPRAVVPASSNAGPGIHPTIERQTVPHASSAVRPATALLKLTPQQDNVALARQPYFARLPKKPENVEAINITKHISHHSGSTSAVSEVVRESNAATDPEKTDRQMKRVIIDQSPTESRLENVGRERESARRPPLRIKPIVSLSKSFRIRLR